MTGSLAHGGAAEMVPPGHNGELFPVGDTGAYVGKLTVLADRAVSGRMGRNARPVVQALFSERAMVDRHEKVLLELCTKPLRPGEALAG